MSPLRLPADSLVESASRGKRVPKFYWVWFAEI
jgi:hypothetical protein